MITLLVFMNPEAQKTGHRVLERRFVWDDSLRFPFEETVRVMKALYGSTAVIQINVE